MTLPGDIPKVIVIVNQRGSWCPMVSEIKTIPPILPPILKVVDNMQFLFILSNIRLTRLFLCFCVPDCTLQQLCWLSGSFSWFYFAPGLIDCPPAVFSGAGKDRWQRVFPFLNSLYLAPQTVRWALPACPVLPLSADCLLPHHSATPVHSRAGHRSWPRLVSLCGNSGLFSRDNMTTPGRRSDWQIQLRNLADSQFCSDRRGEPSGQQQWL